MLIALWDDATRTLCVANAGSVQPLLVNNVSGERRVQTIEVEGFPLGLFPTATYEETLLELKSGDLAIFFSDGITDAVDPEGEEFGGARLRTLLEDSEAAGLDAQSVVNLVLEAVKTHQAGAEHFDDETLVVLRAR